MRSLIKRFIRDEMGATAVEYALIVAGISIAIITALQGIGTKLADTFRNVSQELKK